MRIIKNYLYNGSYQLLLIILPIVTLPYVARTLGPTHLGINSYTYSITNYFVLIAVLGTTTYAQREIAYIKDSPKKIIHFFWEIEALNIIATLFSYAILIVVIYVVPSYKIFLWAYSINIIANVLDVSWLFMGMEKFSILSLRNFAVKLVSVILIFTLVRSSSDLLVYILINSCSTLFSNMLLWPYIRRWNIYSGLREMSRLHPFKHLKGTVALFIPQISITLYTLLNKVVLGSFGRMRESSYFDNSDKIVRLAFTLLFSLSTVLMPVIASEISKKNQKKVMELLKRSLLFSLCISIALFFGFLGISDRLVPLLLGQQYNPVSILLKIQGFIVIPMAIANVVGNQYLVPSRKTKELNISIFSGSIFNIIISVPMIMKWGALGATIAILFSETLVTATQLFQVRNELKFVGIFKEIMKFIVAAIIMLIAVTITLKILHGWSSLIISIGMGIMIYFSLLVIMRATIMKDLISIIRMKFIK